MRSRLMLLAALVVANTGCYTVLRHPDTRQDELETQYADYADYTYDDLSAVESCTACHGGLAVRSGPYLPGWQRYYEQPWWTRVASATPHSQGSGLVNDRGRPLMPSYGTPTPISPAIPTVVPVVKVEETLEAPATRQGESVDRPRDAAPAPAPRTGDVAPAPHPERETPATQGPQPAPSDPPPSPTRQGQGLDNDRRSPRP